MKDKLVMLPALMCDERLFKHQVETLSPIFDISIFSFNTINNIKDAALHVIQSMRDSSFHLMGISMGGYIAMEIMRHNAKVKSLGFINTSFEIDNDTKKLQRIEQIQQVKKITDDQFIGVNDNIIKQYIYNLSSSKVQLIKDMAKDAGRISFINQQELILSRSSSVEEFKNYNIPTLIVSSTQDTITPISVQKRMVNNLKKGILVNIDNCSHLSPIDQPESLSSLLECWYKGLSI